MSETPHHETDVPAGETPVGDLEGLRKHWSKDALSGFLVFLIALPLCLGIALASGYPPIAGVFTAIIGGILTPFISNSELTIKGPAAGLIVIAIGCIGYFGGDGAGNGWDAADQHAYQAALAVGLAAAVAQVVFGLLRGGILGEFFPTSAVHGMLAAIGIIIMVKQIPIALGLSAAGSPVELILNIPDEIVGMNPAIALIGGLSLAIMFLWPLIKQRHLSKIPAPMVVLLVSVPLGLYLGLNAESHGYTFRGQDFELGRSFLVNVPDSMFGALTMPDFSALLDAGAWKWIAMFAIIGTLESLLSAKAIDLIDPWKRKTSLDRDDASVGIGNIASAMVGGLPMISEIVRSRANIDNGARTRFANLFHALFLFLFVASVPALISLIPMAALGAMLVYTGFRLAHPKEFIHVYEVGPEQLIVFVATIIGVLTTDLLIGIGIGIGVELLVHLVNGAPLTAVFRAKLDIAEEGGRATVTVHDAALFTSWIGLKRRLEKLDAKSIVVDLAKARLVDHTVMEKLHGLKKDLGARGVQLEIAGLERHRAVSAHPHATRKLSATT